MTFEGDTRIHLTFYPVKLWQMQLLWMITSNDRIIEFDYFSNEIFLLLS
jgi:hypothetical protein